MRNIICKCENWWDYGGFGTACIIKIITISNILSFGGIILNDFTIYNYNDFRWNGRYIQFTDSAKLHLDEFGLDAHEIIDMLHDPVDCPEHRKFRRTDIEICSRKKRRIFRIILFEDFCYDVKEICWCVKHVEPT